MPSMKNIAMFTVGTSLGAWICNWAMNEMDSYDRAYASVEALRCIPEFHVSGLPSLLNHYKHNKPVILRGVVLPRSLVNNVGSGGPQDSLSESSDDTLRSPNTGQQVVVVDESIVRTYNQRSSSLMEFNKNKCGKEVVSRTRKQVPFVIADSKLMPCKYVVVDFEGTLVNQVVLEKASYDKEEIIFSHNQKGYELQVEEIKEEHILPVGKVVSIVGLFSSKNGTSTIKPYQYIPYFITTKTKQELIAEQRAALKRLYNIREIVHQFYVGWIGFAIGANVTILLSYRC